MIPPKKEQKIELTAPIFARILDAHRYVSTDTYTRGNRAVACRVEARQASKSRSICPSFSARDAGRPPRKQINASRSNINSIIETKRAGGVAGRSSPARGGEGLQRKRGREGGVQGYRGEDEG